MSRVRLAQAMCIDTTCRHVQKLGGTELKSHGDHERKGGKAFEDNPKVS